MRYAGYTLIELLVVISIMVILSIVAMVSVKDFSSDQILNKAVGQVQTLLRLVQSNATASVLCNGQGAIAWSLIIDTTNIELHCEPANFLYRNYPLENYAQVDAISCASNRASLPVSLSYPPGAGTLVFSSNPDDPSNTCSTADSWTFTIKNTKNDNTKSFKINRGGAINVQ